MKKKGFTLIELLAVIIILAVIALIATPIVLNVIENSRKESAKNSAYGAIDAAKLAYTESLLTSTVVTSGDVKDLSVAGEKSNVGTWSINTATGVVTITGASYNGYSCSGTVNSMTCTK